MYNLWHKTDFFLLSFCVVRRPSLWNLCGGNSQKKINFKMCHSMKEKLKSTKWLGKIFQQPKMRSFFSSSSFVLREHLELLHNSLLLREIVSFLLAHNKLTLSVVEWGKYIKTRLSCTSWCCMHSHFFSL